jgi:UDP-N-acetylglucosamine 2-epimerase (non-hydrolysing)
MINWRKFSSCRFTRCLIIIGIEMSMPLKIINVVGARPNFMKIAPIINAMKKRKEIEYLLVHTGQHYDQKMSKSFFDDLGLPKPDLDLGVGSGTHAQQTAGIMVEFEKILVKEKPDLVLVVGDVNSTMACTITAKKLNIKVGHVEAGLRSRDMTMPEEINRLCTDVLCDYLFTTDHFADENLANEGVAEDKVFFTGNVMIDTLLSHKEQASQLGTWQKFGLQQKDYIAMTMHRPGNVDDCEVLKGILEVLKDISKDIALLFPMHPRTAKMIHSFGLDKYFRSIEKAEGKVSSGLWSTGPLGYLEFLNLNMNSKMVLTDSGGLQEETTVLGVPCVTMRPNTERPITCELGTNIIVGNTPVKIKKAVNEILKNEQQNGIIPPKWDGKAGQRIVDILIEQMRAANG